MTSDKILRATWSTTTNLLSSWLNASIFRDIISENQVWVLKEIWLNSIKKYKLAVWLLFGTINPQD